MALPTTTRSPSTANLKGWIPQVSQGPQLFDPTTVTAHELQEQLQAGKLKSTEILHEYYRHILKYNGYLNAVYELAPGALERAKELDAKRAQGEHFGPLHGIPVLVKDNISTHPSLGMGTTAGGVAMLDSKPKRNAPVVDRLLEAGAIILGKATLSEYGYFKGNGIRCGWSAVAGQGQNPYIKGGLDYTDGLGGHSSPGGSSSGPAISVAAGLAPIALGTETEGSLLSPATRASLYSLKPTLGLVSNEGIIPVSARFDTAGPLATNVKDVADLATILVDTEKAKVSAGGYASAMYGAEGWKELKIGTLDPKKWRYGEGFQKQVPEAIEQIITATEEAYAKIKSLAKEYHHNVNLRPSEDFELDGQNAVVTMLIAEFKQDMDNYLSGLEFTKCKNLAEIIEYNKAHFKEALTDEYPDQALLEQSLAFEGSTARRQKILDHIKEVATSLPETLARYDIDVIVGPADGPLSIYSAATGGPLAAIPLTYIDYNGRPIGLVALTTPYQESTLIKLMSAFEASFAARKVPTAYIAEGKVH